jgi:hypothetical protein
MADDDVSMEPPTSAPATPGSPGSDDLDPVAVELARAVGAQLRTPPSEEVRRAHVAEAASAVAAAGAPEVGVDRAVTDVLPDIHGRGPGRGPRRPGGRGKTRMGADAGRSARRRVIPAAAVLLALVAGVTSWVGRSGPDLPVIALGGGGAGAAPMTVGDEAMSRESAAAAADAPMAGMIWFPVDYTFILEDGARSPAASGPAWRFVPPDDLAASAVRLATRFGMPAMVPSEWDPATLQSQTPQGDSLSLMPTGEWYFGAAPDPDLQWRCPDFAPEVRPAEPAGEGELAILPAYECEPPPPAVGLPSEDEARRLATALFADLGITGIRFETPYVDDWTVSLWGLVPVAGAPPELGQYVGVGFGARGTVLFANGSLARPIALGEYPTITSEAALDRLRAQLEVPAGAPVAQPYPADLEPSAQDSLGPVDEERQQERQQVTVRMVSVELSTQLAWTREGELLLVPHYRFRDADGGEWWVVAVADRYLAG